jgi:hypothetical protein
MVRRPVYSSVILSLPLVMGEAADGALHVKRLELPSIGSAQLDVRAAVVEAALVDLDALVAGRVVDLHAAVLLAGGAVVDHDLAGEQLGHAGGVVLDDELLELDRERQLLQQDAVGLAQDGGAGLRALGHHRLPRKVGLAELSRCSGLTSAIMPPPA